MESLATALSQILTGAGIVVAVCLALFLITKIGQAVGFIMMGDEFDGNPLESFGYGLLTFLIFGWVIWGCWLLGGAVLGA